MSYDDYCKNGLSDKFKQTNIQSIDAGSKDSSDRIYNACVSCAVNTYKKDLNSHNKYHPNQKIDDCTQKAIENFNLSVQNACASKGMTSFSIDDCKNTCKNDPNMLACVDNYYNAHYNDIDADY